MNQSEDWSEKQGEGTEAGIEPTIFSTEYDNIISLLVKCSS